MQRIHFFSCLRKNHKLLAGFMESISFIIKKLDVITLSKENKQIFIYTNTRALMGFTFKLIINRLEGFRAIIITSSIE